MFHRIECSYIWIFYRYIYKKDHFQIATGFCLKDMSQWFAVRFSKPVVSIFLLVLFLALYGHYSRPGWMSLLRISGILQCTRRCVQCACSWGNTPLFQPWPNAMRRSSRNFKQKVSHFLQHCFSGVTYGNYFIKSFYIPTKIYQRTVTRLSLLISYRCGEQRWTCCE